MYVCNFIFIRVTAKKIIIPMKSNEEFRRIFGNMLWSHQDRNPLNHTVGEVVSRDHREQQGLIDWVL